MWLLVIWLRKFSVLCLEVDQLWMQDDTTKILKKVVTEAEARVWRRPVQQEHLQSHWLLQEAGFRVYRCMA